MEEPLKVIPSIFAESMYMVEGRPMRLTGRPYLRPIYDTDMTEILLKTGRQVEKSTTLATQILNWSLTTPGFRSLYVAPLMEQVKAFSRDRLTKMMMYSQNDVIKKNFLSKDLANAVFSKEFTNRSIIHLRHCFEEGDNIRGLSTNGNFIDEIQDILVDALPVINETQAHWRESEAGIRVNVYSGTPKTFSNTIEQLHLQSTRAEWVVICCHCKTHQILGIKNMRPDALVCRKCELPISKFDYDINGNPTKDRYNVRATGYWKEMNPGAKMKGFRISQLMVSWITPEELWYKYITYPPDRFHNEVLGLSYENAVNPFTEAMIESIIDPDLPMVYRAEGEFSNANIFMGVDWGTGEKSYTVVVVGMWWKDRFRVLYAKVFDMGEELDPEYQLREIARLMTAFKVKLCVADWGMGFVQLNRLRHQFGTRVVPCYYSHSQKEKIKFDYKKQRWVVNRTDSLFDYITLVQHNRTVWPGMEPGTGARPDDIKVLKANHLAVQAEYRAGQNGRSEELYYSHPASLPDDGFHACHYAWLASQLAVNAGFGEISFASAYSR